MLVDLDRARTTRHSRAAKRQLAGPNAVADLQPIVLKQCSVLPVCVSCETMRAGYEPARNARWSRALQMKFHADFV